MSSIVRHEDFARRFTQACETNPNVPSPNYGRLGFFVDEFDKRYGVTLTAETVRKWLHGLSRPHPHSKMEQLAEILRVDVAWLATGSLNAPSRKQVRVRSETASGSLNLVAGLVQMSGSYPAFPADDDRFAKENCVDLYAIIRGTQHAFHVTVAEVGADGFEISVPLDARNVITLVVVPKPNLEFEIVEVDQDVLLREGEVRGEVVVAPLDAVKKRRVTTFAQKF